MNYHISKDTGLEIKSTPRHTYTHGQSKKERRTENYTSASTITNILWVCLRNHIEQEQIRITLKKDRDPGIVSNESKTKSE
jgi:hypothetical protein